jgi:protein-tyrosine phosphatase
MRDEHCHIIPAVDDGSTSFKQSLRMLDKASEAGIDRIVCTPHMRWDDFDGDKVLRNFNRVKQEAAQRGIEMSLGYEVFYKRLLKIGLDQAPCFVQEGTNRILIEFNTGGSCTQGWDRTFDTLQSEYGLDITVAHPERYATVLDDFDTVYKMKDMGCRLQVSAADLFAAGKGGDAMGKMARPMAKCAKRLLKEGLCDAIVSDAHNPDHYKHFAKAMKKFAKYL